ncbi:MAG: sensor histidine kinase, partial [Sphingobacteriales bacterium]
YLLIKIPEELRHLFLHLKTNKHFVICILFFLANTNFVFSQTKKIEVLKASIYNSSGTSQKLDAVLALCGQAHSMNIDTLYHYANLAKQMAIALNDGKKKILADTYIETWLGRKNLYDSALKICNSDIQNLSYANEGDVYAKEQMQRCFLLMMKNKNRKEIIDKTFHFLHEAEANQDTASQIYCKYIIGRVYKSLQQPELALQWCYKAGSTANGDVWDEKKNEFGLYFLMGQMYNWKYDADVLNKEKISDSLKSMFYTDKAISLSRKYENLSILARALGLKAADEIDNPKQIANAGKYVNESIHIYDQLHDTLSMLNGFVSMSVYYLSIGQPEKGVAVCRKGIEITKTGAYGFNRVEFYWSLAHCYKVAGNYKKTAEVLDTVILLKDSAYNKNSERDLADLNAKYEDQKKENTIIHQKLDIASKKNAMYVASFLLVFLFIGVLFLYSYYHKRNKEQKQKEIEAVDTAKENERKRISADLHDNIGAYAAAAASTIAIMNPEDAKSRKTLQLLKNDVHEMITQLNDSIWALNRNAVLLTAISDRFKLFVQKLEHAYPDISIMINEEIESDKLLSPFQALHLSRILQESLNNALRHSKCHQVNINIFSNGKLMQVTIRDDGIGMDNANFNGNGINNLKRRAKESGWNVEWINNAETGTSVIISTDAIVPATSN